VKKMATNFAKKKNATSNLSVRRLGFGSSARQFFRVSSLMQELSAGVDKLF